MVGIREISARRMQIAREREALDKEETELGIAERVLKRLESKASATGRRAETVPSDIPPQWATAMEALGDDIMESTDLRGLIDATRDSPITDGSFQALLSKMKSAGLIQRKGSLVRKTRHDENEAPTGNAGGASDAREDGEPPPFFLSSNPSPVGSTS